MYALDRQPLLQCAVKFLRAKIRQRHYSVVVSDVVTQFQIESFSQTYGQTEN